jgi:hypothetical protein
MSWSADIRSLGSNNSYVFEVTLEQAIAESRMLRNPPKPGVSPIAKTTSRVVVRMINPSAALNE